MNSSNNAAASSRRSDSNMDCGSLLPLSPGSPAADKGQTTLDGQQAGLPKAVAGCRSPRKWLRRLFWTVVTLVSLLTVYYQWENRRSARELQLAREHLLERIGTENWLDLAPPVVPDEQNFFALPVIEQWMHRDGRQVRYVIPKNVFLPPNFVSPAILENEADGTSRVDFAGWAKNRDLKGESPAIVMNRELGDGNGLLPKLAAGLSRPFSAWKPHQHDELAAAGADPYDAIQPHVSNVNDQMRQLGLHLRVAAAAGDVEKARSTALILLRLFPESASSRQCLIGSLVSIATHGIAFEALQDALSKPAWDENGLHALQLQLGRINDLEVMEQAMSMETLTGYGVGLFIRESCRKDGLAVEMLRFGQEDNSWLARIGAHATRFGYIYGPCRLARCEHGLLRRALPRSARSERRNGVAGRWNTSHRTQAASRNGISPHRLEHAPQNRCGGIAKHRQPLPGRSRDTLPPPMPHHRLRIGEAPPYTRRVSGFARCGERGAELEAVGDALRCGIGAAFLPSCVRRGLWRLPCWWFRSAS
jgi:hypothetical protein